MANTIITKNSSTASAVPTSGDLVQGELAVNVTDKRLFTENASGTVVELGTNPSSVTTGNLAYTGTLTGGTGVVNLGSGQVYKDASGNVGIGTSSPSDKLEVTGNIRATASNYFVMGSSGSGDVSVRPNGAGGARGLSFYAYNGGSYETMRIDSSGNLLVGTTATDLPSTSTEEGLTYLGGNYLAVSREGTPFYLNRLATDGDIAVLRKDGATVGSIGTLTSQLYIVSGDTGLRFAQTVSDIRPVDSTGANRDNVIDLGDSAARFDDIFATNGTIQTSDRNEKQDIEALSEAEQRVAVACKGLLRKFRWKDAVAVKGDEARIHFGIIAQDLQAAFAAEGLDAGRYAMFISGTWWEAEVEKTREVEQEDGTTVTETYTATETYDEATEGATERTRLGVRYPELLAFIIAAI